MWFTEHIFMVLLDTNVHSLYCVMWLEVADHLSKGQFDGMLWVPNKAEQLVGGSLLASAAKIGSLLQYSGLLSAQFEFFQSAKMVLHTCMEEYFIFISCGATRTIQVKAFKNQKVYKYPLI